MKAEGTMFAFVVMALIGLAVMTVTAIAGSYVSIAAEVRRSRSRLSGLVPPG